MALISSEMDVEDGGAEEGEAEEGEAEEGDAGVVKDPVASAGGGP